MTTQTTLQQLHAKVWQWRKYMDENSDWKTPPPLDALRFAVCEASEGLDAFLRQKGGYARNNDKEHSIHRELAQCAIMLFTALGPDKAEWDDFMDTSVAKTKPITIEKILFHTVHALEDYLRKDESWPWTTQFALTTINAYPNMDLETELNTAMQRLQQKHAHPPQGEPNA